MSTQRICINRNINLLPNVDITSLCDGMVTTISAGSGIYSGTAGLAFQNLLGDVLLYTHYRVMVSLEIS